MTNKTAKRRADPFALPAWPGSELLEISLGSAQLWADSWAVIAMRTGAILTQQPGSGREAVRMVTEKFEAQFELAGKLAFTPGNPVKTSLDHYAKRVTANRRRLERK